MYSDDDIKDSQDHTQERLINWYRAQCPFEEGANLWPASKYGPVYDLWWDAYGFDTLHPIGGCGEEEFIKYLNMYDSSRQRDIPVKYLEAVVSFIWSFDSATLAFGSKPC